MSSLATPAGTFSYAYDNRGNISSVSDGTYTTSYTYDNLNQLIREDNEKNNRTYVYAYSNGNLLSRSAYEYTAPNVTPTGVLHVYNLEYTAYTWKDLLVKYDGVSMAYDGNGQITSFDGMALSWDYLGLLGSAGSTTYSYDTSGRRLSKTTGSTVTNYYYAGDLLVGQKTGNNKIEFIYDSNGDYYGFEYNGVPYNYIKNLQGDVIAIADGSANILVRYEYDAWGRHLKITDTTGIRLGNINPIRYRGYYFDEETGFYYLKTRYYSPEICRFLSADSYVSTGQGILGYNMFAYCNNNPIVFYDNNGQFPVLACILIGGFALTFGLLGFFSNEKLIEVGKTNKNDNEIFSVNVLDINHDTVTQNDANNSLEQNIELTTADRVINTCIGVGVGLATGGLIVASLGAVGCVLVGPTIEVGLFGATCGQFTAIGALAYSIYTALFAPFIDSELEPIEWIQKFN